MAFPPARISLAVSVPQAVIKVAGRAAVERTRDFKAAVQNLAVIGVREIFIDLSECLLMDSMFSGMVANLAAGPDLRFTLVDANQRVTDLLANLGALELFRVAHAREGMPDLGPVKELPVTCYDKRATTECCLEAHRFLMELQQENKARFETLEKVLQAELDAPAPAEPMAPATAPALPSSSVCPAVAMP